MSFGNLPGQVEPQPQSGRLGACHERMKESIGGLGGQTWPLIVDAEEYPGTICSLLSVDLYLDGRILWSIFDGIGQQVLYHLAQSVRVSAEYHLLRNLDFNLGLR